MTMYSEKFTAVVYRHLARFDARVSMIPREDVMQEIRYSLLICKSDTVFKVAHHYVEKLLGDYGFSRKMGKDNYDPKRLYDDRRRIDDDRIKVIESLYIDSNMTAKEVCRTFGIEPNNEIAKKLSRVFPKGGARSGKTGKPVPFDEVTAAKAVEAHSLNKNIIKLWRHRGGIPVIYCDN